MYVPDPRAEERQGQLDPHTCTVIVGPTHTKAHTQWLVESSHTETQECVSHLHLHVSHCTHMVFRIAINTNTL